MDKIKFWKIEIRKEFVEKYSKTQMSTTKLTYQQVTDRLKQKGVTLLTKTYINSSQKLEYECLKCKEKGTTSMQAYPKRKIWCPVCTEGSHCKKTHAMVAAMFERRGFKLISHYEGSMTKSLDYICKCGVHDKMPLTRFNRKIVGGCKECVAKLMAKNSMEKYGVDHPKRSKEVQNKTVATNMERYGMKNPGNHPDVVKKIKETNLKRFGCHPMKTEQVKEKQRQVMQTKYGADNPMQNKAIRTKQSQTCMKKYGVDNVMKVPEIYHKAQNSFEKKDYKLPSGKIAKLQGYEHFALDILLENYNEDQISYEKEDIPVVQYTFNDKSCKFYPDFYISHENKIIEVKSIFTYSRFEQKNLTKIKECAKQGYEIEFWIFDKKGKFVEKFFTRKNKLFQGYLGFQTQINYEIAPLNFNQIELVFDDEPLK